MLSPLSLIPPSLPLSTSLSLSMYLSERKVCPPSIQTGEFETRTGLQRERERERVCNIVEKDNTFGRRWLIHINCVGTRSDTNRSRSLSMYISISRVSDRVRPCLGDVPRDICSLCLSICLSICRSLSLSLSLFLFLSLSLLTLYVHVSRVFPPGSNRYTCGTAAGVT